MLTLATNKQTLGPWHEAEVCPTGPSVLVPAFVGSTSMPFKCDYRSMQTRAIFLSFLHVLGLKHRAETVPVANVDQEYFGDVLLSMLTLFQLMTLDSWTGFARPMIEVQPWTGGRNLTTFGCRIAVRFLMFQQDQVHPIRLSGLFMTNQDLYLSPY